MNIISRLDIFTDDTDRRVLYWNDEKYYDETIPYYSKAVRLPRSNAFFNIKDWGDDHWYPGRKLLNRNTEYYMFHFIYGGTGTFNGFPVSAGDLLIVSPGTPHTILGSYGDPLKFYWISVGGIGAKEVIFYAENFKQQDDVIFTTSYPSDEVLPLLRSGTLLQGEVTYCAQKLYAMFFSILSLLPRTAPNQSKKKLCPTVQKAVDYIERHFRESLSVSDLAGRFHISRNYLYRLFIRDLGISPNDYITEYRIRISAMLLEAEYDIPISEIAVNSGFPEYSRFAKTFRKIMHMTPKEYRKNVSESKTNG